jgi:hypothetical protein
MSGYNVSRQQVLQLPIGRNAYNTVGLAPGVMGNASAGTNSGAIISGGTSQYDGSVIRWSGDAK